LSTDDVVEPDATRNELREEMHELMGRYLDTWGEDFVGGHIATYYVVAEVVLPAGGRTILEFGSEMASPYNVMGLLHAALHDPRWLDNTR
jgi:hypothetical protein